MNLFGSTKCILNSKNGITALRNLHETIFLSKNEEEKQMKKLVLEKEKNVYFAGFGLNEMWTAYQTCARNWSLSEVDEVYAVKEELASMGYQVEVKEII
jgi:anaerobic ribonucleoside-triphosphate reductase